MTPERGRPKGSLASSEKRRVPRPSSRHSEHATVGCNNWESAAAGIDLFDRAQLAAVIQIFRRRPTVRAAGRALFTTSREKRASTNDADRLRKYLRRFDLDWAAIRDQPL